MTPVAGSNVLLGYMYRLTSAKDDGDAVRRFSQPLGLIHSSRRSDLHSWHYRALSSSHRLWQGQFQPEKCRFQPGRNPDLAGKVKLLFAAPALANLSVIGCVWELDGSICSVVPAVFTFNRPSKSTHKIANSGLYSRPSGADCTGSRDRARRCRARRRRCYPRPRAVLRGRTRWEHIATRCWSQNSRPCSSSDCCR